MIIPAETLFMSNTIGKIIAINVPESVYLRDYAEYFCEWVNGTVIKMSPVHSNHDALSRYLATLLSAYFELKALGDIRQAPFVMRLDLGEGRVVNREPDIQVILQDNPHDLTPTRMNGAADIVIEIVSPESIERDYAEKLREYEQGGVREYWIIHPEKREARFYRLNNKGAYLLQDIENSYETPLLPRLQIDIPTLWMPNLPKPLAIAQMVQGMLGE